MNSYSTLLIQGAIEVREYLKSSSDAAAFNSAWLESIATRMENASATLNMETQKKEIQTISRLLTDSGPMDSKFSPSFKQALDALQRSRKRNG